ncbi:MAG: hypothetical protein AAGK97_12190 [Bacteroidota bacterium]
MTNDITVSSELGLEGNINIGVLDINPVQGATELSTNVIVSEQTTAQVCQANRKSAARNGLVISGKGGIPPAPDLPLSSLNTSIDGKANNISTIPAPVITSLGKIQPAKGIELTESGIIRLTAYRTNNAGDRLPEGSANCNQAFQAE